MNPHAQHPSSPGALWRSCWNNRHLIAQLTKREVVGRYRGSVFGLAWSFFYPVLMLVVYTFVFSEIFKARWGANADASRFQFALVLFVGMIVLGIFSDVLTKSSSLILSNTNYVKKVVFPVEILPVVTTAGALFHGLVSLLVLIIALVLANGALPLTILALPLALAPLVLLALGAGWIVSSLGVFLRDVGQVMSIFTTVLLFLSPVFYPITAVPEDFRSLIALNPLTFVIEQARAVLIWGRWPDWMELGVSVSASAAFAWLGYYFFQKTRKGFADVL